MAPSTDSITRQADALSAHTDHSDLTPPWRPRRDAATVVWPTGRRTGYRNSASWTSSNAPARQRASAVLPWSRLSVSASTAVSSTSQQYGSAGDRTPTSAVTAAGGSHAATL